MTNFYEKLLLIKPEKSILFSKKNHIEINRFASIFQLNDEEARTLLCLANYYFRKEDSTCSLNTFCEDLKISHEEYTKLLKIISRLIELSLIRQENSYARHKTYKLYPEIQISEDVKCYLLSGERTKIKVDYSSIHAIFDYLDSIYEEFSEHEDLNKVRQQISEIICNIKSGEFKTVLQSLELDNAALLLYLFTEYFKGNCSISLNRCLELFYKRLSMRINIKMQFLNEKAELIQKELVKLEETQDMFLDDTLNIILTEKSKELLEQRPTIITFKTHNLKTINHGTIKTKLVFDSELKKKIETLQTALTEERLTILNEVLKEKELPLGFICLLYGESGTGKTATVYETAKITKRNILQVDISTVRNKWVGDSEKNLKSIFTYYNAAKKYYPETPILLFNEADALIGCRTSVNNSVDQMNNSMQNILLEELEKFDGIFFSTTNLMDNFDDAFSRRFLYKIEYKKPSQELREKIWKLKIPDLDKDIIKELSTFPTTGGQIENIVRKATIDSVIYNKKITFESFRELIEEEISFKRKSTVGF